MKIGEFAKICSTKISVLRHYDKLGVLRPVYIDHFTDYRYYDKSQIAIFNRISELKAVGFTLAEIKYMLYSGNGDKIREMFADKQAELEHRLHNLDNLRQIMSGGIIMKQNFEPFVENVNLPFENDQQVIGKWMVLDPCDDSDNYPTLLLGNGNRELYFLPDGNSYWCYSWTKGKLFFGDGVNKFANDYRVERRGDDLYMTIAFKSFDYKETGETVDITLRKMDSVHYTAEEIARKDDINKPFVNDKRVIGTWKSFVYIDSTTNMKKDFVPHVNPAEAWCYENLYFKELEFMEGGHCRTVFEDEVICSDDMQTWTNGYLLRKWNGCACAYEIQVIDGKEYLIIEWKSGDYRWGGRETSYYVFVRA